MWRLILLVSIGYAQAALSGQDGGNGVARAVDRKMHTHGNHMIVRQINRYGYRRVKKSRAAYPVSVPVNAHSAWHRFMSATDARVGISAKVGGGKLKATTLKFSISFD